MPSIQLPNQPNTTNRPPQSLLTTLRAYRLSGQKALAVLLDPDKIEQNALSDLLIRTTDFPVDFFLVGGSLVTDYVHKEVIATIRHHNSTHYSVSWQSASH